MSIIPRLRNTVLVNCDENVCTLSVLAGLHTHLLKVHHTRVKYSLPPTAFSTPYAGGIASSCAPSKGATHFILSGANSSAPGFVLLMMLISSKMPALITLMPLMPPNESPCRKSVVPQSGQKWPERGQAISLDTCGAPPMNLLVISLPLSAILLICLGVPDRTLKFSLGTTMLFE